MATSTILTTSIRTLFSLLLVLLTSLTAISQVALNREWQTFFGDPESDQWAQTIMDGDGNIYTTGNTRISDSETAILTTKMDCDGVTAWEDEFTHPGGTAMSYGVALALDQSGNLYVAGMGRLASSGDYDLLVVKYSSSGNQSWQYVFNGGGDDIGTGIVVDANANVYVSTASQGTSTGFDYRLVKLNSSGSVAWNNAHNFSSLDDFPVGIELSPDESGAIVTGVSASSATVWDFATLRRSTSSGSLTATNTTDAQGVVLDEPAGFGKDASGNFYIAGTVTTSPGHTIIKTIKLDASLNPVWQTGYDGAGKTSKARAISVDVSGNVYVGGHDTDASENVHSLLIKYSASGTEEWTRIRQPRAGESSEILCSAIDYAGNVAVASEVTENGKSYSAVQKFSADGDPLWEYSVREGDGKEETPKDIFPKDDCVTVTEVIVRREQEQERREYRNRKFCTSDCGRSSGEVVVGESGDTLWAANQIVIKFSRTVVNTAFVDDVGKQFGTLEEIITDSLLIVQMDSVLGAGGSLRSGWEMQKIFKRLTTDKVSTQTRMGRTLPVNDFWTTFLMCLPEGSDAAKDIPATAQQLMGSLFRHRIVYAHPNYLYFPDGCPASDERYTDWQANLHPTTASNNTWLNGHINIEDAWCFEQGKDYIKVGVYDDGIDWEHEDFGNGTQAGSKIKGGFDYKNTQSFPSMVPNGGGFSHHGTACAGIIGALRNNAITPSGYSVAGIAGGNVDGTGNAGVSLFAMRISEGNSFAPSTVIANAFSEGSLGNTDPTNGFVSGLNIFSNSWGGNSVDPTIERQVYFAYRNEVILGASRGNAGTDDPRYPCTYEDEWIMCIGASDTEGHWKMQDRNFNPNDQSGSDNDKVYQSNYGLTLDLIAPGTSALIRTTEAFVMPNAPFPYRWFKKTSAAVPHVTGTASLMLSHVNSSSPAPENLAPEDVETIIQMTAKDSELLPSTTGYDEYAGWGLLDVSAAMALIRKPKYRIIHVPEEGGTISKTSTLVNSSVQVSIEEPVGTLQPGDYIAEQHEFTLTYDHQSLMSAYDLLGSWNRNSASEGYATSVTDDLTAARKTCQIVSIDENQGVLKTHNYRITHKINPGGGQTPVTPTWVVGEECPYSLHVDDPTISSVKDDVHDNVNILNIFPNPTSGLFTISYQNTSSQQVKIGLYNGSGVLIKTVFEGTAQPGVQSVEVDATALQEGVYFCRLVTGNGIGYGKLVKVKQ
jgi:Subtilase family/Secretion system C-terminal sorting domain